MTTATKTLWDEMNTVHYFSNGLVSHELSKRVWEDDVRKHTAMYYDLKDMKEMDSTDVLASMITTNCNFWIETINPIPFQRKGYTLCTLTLNYVNRPIDVYMKNEVVEYVKNNCTSKRKFNR